MLILFAPSAHRARTVRTALLRACNACIALQQGVLLVLLNVHTMLVLLFNRESYSAPRGGEATDWLHSARCLHNTFLQTQSDVLPVANFAAVLNQCDFG